METETLVTLSIPIDKVTWMEEGREIMIEGKMFDIKSYYEEDGKLIAVGVYDEKETRVMELLYNFNDKQQNNLVINLFLLAQSFIFLIFFLITIINTTPLVKHFSFIVLRTSNPYLQQFFPPPRCFFHS